MKTLIANPNAPQSVQLARYLIGEIQAGRLRPGEKLDSVRQLAERFGVGRQVVLSAFTLLVKQNFACSEARRGLFVNPEIQSGHFYRLGFFINRNNPARGRLLNRLHNAALRYGWQLVSGSNYEEDFELSDWLKRKTDIDGVIISGMVDDEILKETAAGCLPYVVLGNYDISPAHPQVHSLIPDEAESVMTREIRERNLHRLVAICGPDYLCNERTIGTRLEKVMRTCGLNPEDAYVVYAKDDGYPEISRIMQQRPPEAFFFLGEHCLGWRKYRRQHPGQLFPQIMISEYWNEVLTPSEYDTVIQLREHNRIEERAVLKMLELLNVKPSI